MAPALIQPTARERILYFFDEYARYSSEITDISLTKLLYNSNNKCFDRPSEQGIRRVLGEQVQQGLQAGEFHSEEGAAAMVDFLMIAARGLVYNWCTHDGGYPIRPAMKRYVERLLRAWD